jgi:hypothetical protein
LLEAAKSFCSTLVDEDIRPDYFPGPFPDLAEALVNLKAAIEQAEGEG